MRNVLKWALFPAILLAALAGCEQTTTTEPGARPAMEASKATATVSGYRLIESAIPDEAATLELSSLIGVLGGELRLGGHSIVVPPGAVSSPTLFTMTVLRNGHVEVELTAVVNLLLRGVLDVGSGGFGDKTVALTLSYAAATNVEDPEDLLILRMLDDGGVEPLEVVVDESGKRVTAQLDHFSRYCMASN